jgi:hypothetical protein
MKNILLIISTVFSLTLSATNYFISSTNPSADDSNNGTAPASPWRTFAPLDTATILAGDTIFLKSGDIFRGGFTINNVSDIVVTSYETGSKPVISGAEIVYGWTLSGNYYYTSFNQNIINFFADNQEQILARYPDEGNYLTVDTATNNYLQDNALSAIQSATLNSSQVCIHTAQWCWEKSAIASSTNNTVSYASPTLRVPTAGYGYFLYDDTSYITTGKEWKYDAAVQKLYFKPETGHPDSILCEASVHPYGILLGSGANNISIVNIAFEKQAEAGVGILNASNTNIKIEDCFFARQYKYGIDIQGINAEISNCYFREIDGLAIYINGAGFSTEVHHNIFRNNGGFRNSGVGQEINGSSIKGAFVDSNHIHHNDIDSAGYCGISMDGKWNLIERNIVKNAMLLNNDGAALKSFGTGSQYNLFRNNFVTLSDGNTEGTPNGARFITPAIYFDFSTNHCSIIDNTVYGRTQKGIFLNSGTHDNTVKGNVIYGGNYLLDFNGSPLIPNAMTGMNVTHNVLFAKDNNAYILRMVDNTNGFNQGTIDSNYYFHPYNSARIAFLPPSTSYSFTDWQTNTQHDMNSKNSFVNWTFPTAYDTLFMNPTDSIMAINLGNTQYLDLDSNEVCGTISLQPYSSQILINTGNTCAITSLTGNNIENKILAYPNPASSSVRIQSTDKKSETEFCFINQLGMTVYQGKLTNGSADISIKDFPSGIYVVKLSGKDSQTLRVIKTQ